MKKAMSIHDEMKALQSGELEYSPERLTVCAAYCRHRLLSLSKSLESRAVPDAYREQAKASAQSFSEFLCWVEEQGIQTESLANQGNTL